MKLDYKIYKRYREDIWGNLVKYPNLNAFLCLRLVLFSKGLYQKKKEDFTRNALFKKKNYTPAGLVFLNKQKLRHFYCNLTFKQMKDVYLKSQKLKYDLVDSFIGFLESRIDVVLYRLNFINHMRQAIQFLSYKNVFVNGNCITISNFILSPGDKLEIIDVHEKQRQSLERTLNTNFFLVNYPSYFEVNYKLFSAVYVYRPRVNDVFFPFSVDCQLALQYFKDLT